VNPVYIVPVALPGVLTIFVQFALLAVRIFVYFIQHSCSSLC